MVGLRLSDGVLAQVAAYTAEAVSAVTAKDLSAPTPCAQWDLLSLLLHVNRSLGYLIASLEDSGRRLSAAGPAGSPQIAGMLDGDASEVIAAAVLHRTERFVRAHETIRTGRRPGACDAVAAVGAIEIAVHSWDIARACGIVSPLPDVPAAELLDLAVALLDDAGRPAFFASAVTAPPHAGPGDRLIALLGRDPR